MISQFTKRVGFLYLSIVPFATAAIGFGIGHTDPRIYIPVWLLNSLLMLFAIAVLSHPVLVKKKEQSAQVFITALFLVLPWMCMSLFAGMGRPPTNSPDWVASSGEQQIRYDILIVCGISVTIGLALLKEKLRVAGESFYSQLGFVAIIIAIPFYIGNMVYLGAYLAETLPRLMHTPVTQRPDWYLALRARFVLESVVQVSLTYLATAAFVGSLKKVGWVNPSGSRVYLLFSLLGFILSLMPSDVPDALAIPSYFVSIPAITFIMPYFFGLKLLRRTAELAENGL